MFPEKSNLSSIRRKEPCPYIANVYLSDGYTFSHTIHLHRPRRVRFSPGDSEDYIKNIKLFDFFYTKSGWKEKPAKQWSQTKEWIKKINNNQSINPPYFEYDFDYIKYAHLDSIVIFIIVFGLFKLYKLCIAKIGNHKDYISQEETEGLLSEIEKNTHK